MANKIVNIIIIFIILIFNISFSISCQQPAITDKEIETNNDNKSEDETIETSKENESSIEIKQEEIVDTDEDKDTDNLNEEEATTEEEGFPERQELQKDSFKIGDLIIAEDLEVVVNNIRKSEGADNNIDLIINISITNTGNEDRRISSLYMFNLVDEFKRSQTISLSADLNGELDGVIPPSKTMTGELAYIVNKDLGYLELELLLNITNEEMEVLDSILAAAFSGAEEDDIDKADMEIAEEVGSREPLILEINIE